MFLKGYWELMFERTWTKELYFKKLVLYLAQFCHSAVLNIRTKLNFRSRILQGSAKICLFQDFWE